MSVVRSLDSSSNCFENPSLCDLNRSRSAVICNRTDPISRHPDHSVSSPSRANRTLGRPSMDQSILRHRRTAVNFRFNSVALRPVSTSSSASSSVACVLEGFNARADPADLAPLVDLCVPLVAFGPSSPEKATCESILHRTIARPRPESWFSGSGGKREESNPPPKLSSSPISMSSSASTVLAFVLLAGGAFSFPLYNRRISQHLGLGIDQLYYSTRLTRLTTLLAAAAGAMMSVCADVVRCRSKSLDCVARSCAIAC
jgi:hypothetical protein